MAPEDASAAGDERNDYELRVADEVQVDNDDEPQVDDEDDVKGDEEDNVDREIEPAESEEWYDNEEEDDDLEIDEDDAPPKILVADGYEFKLIPDTDPPVLVDGFLRKVCPPENAVFFLSHFHSDHYCGISGKFAHQIWCSEITGRLVIQNLNVKSSLVKMLPMDEKIRVAGVDVTLLDANHCPGAVMFLFETLGGSKTLHVGDFRWHAKMELYPSLRALKPRDLTHLFLDTTFNDPKYNFPPQDLVVSASIDLCRQALVKFRNPLILFGSYSIGKERVFMACAEALNEKIFVTRKKFQMLEKCNLDMSRFVLDEKKARIHVVSMGRCGFNALCTRSLTDEGYDAYIGFAPTGWNWSKVTKRTALEKPYILRQYNNVWAYGLPYSEHSSYDDLIACAKFLRPKNIQPTVHNTGHSAVAIAQQLVPFHRYIDLSRDRSTIVGMFANMTPRENQNGGKELGKKETDEKKPLARQESSAGGGSVGGVIQTSLSFFFGSK